MRISLGKTLWKVWLKLFDVFVQIFYLLYVVIFILVCIQTKPGFKGIETLFVLYFLVFTIARLVSLFPAWIQGVYLWFYFKFSLQVILKFLSRGIVNYNVTWSLPQWITNLTGISLESKFSDLVFWLGFVISVLFLLDRLERWLLVFLARKIQIGWTKELLDERQRTLLKAKRQAEGITETEKPEAPGNSGTPFSLIQEEDREKIVFRPQFFRDRLWYQPLTFLLITLPVLSLMGWSFSSLAGGKESSNGLLVVFGGTAFLVFLIFLPIFLWEVTTRIILEKDKIIVRTFFFRKTTILYQNIKTVGVGEGGVMEITYEEMVRGGTAYKKARFFPWPSTIEKVLQEFKIRLNNININDSFILEKTRAVRNFTGILVTSIVIGLCLGGTYYMINRATNRPKFSDSDCASHLVFWISDKPKVGVLETKEGFKPSLNRQTPFYFFIDAEKSAPECDKHLSLNVYNATGNIIFQKENLNTPLEGISYYYWEAIFKEKGDYLLKINYGNIPAKKINFSVK